MCKSKRLKDLKIRHIVLLDDYGYDYKDFLFIKKDAESYTFHHIPTGKEVTLRRWKSESKQLYK